MKILIICQYFYPEQFRVSDVSFKLATKGHDVTVLTGLPNYPVGEIFNGYKWKELVKKKTSSQSEYLYKIKAYNENINGVNVLRCKLFPRRKGKINLVINYISFAFNATKVAKRLVSNGYHFDRILVFQYSPITMALPGIVLKNLLRIPLILYCFDLWPESIVSAGIPKRGILYFLLQKISSYIYHQADTLLISSKNFKKYFSKKFSINEVNYLPIYAEDLFTQSIPRKVKRDDNADVHLLFAGNVGVMQSIETIVKAANLLKDHRNIFFHIVGDGSTLEKNINLANSMRLNNIVFHGRHPLEDMFTFYEMADAFLVTLKKDPIISYTLPGKIQSYMAAGKPILAAIDGEAYDTILAAGCGLCCPAEDFKGLADIILEFSKSKSNHRAMGDCAKLYYNENFSEMSFFKSLLSLLE